LIRAKATKRSMLVIACLAGMLFLGSWAAIHHGFYNQRQIIDTPLYQRYGDWMMHGSVPYRDFAIEYPPGALPAFVLPAIGNSGDANAASVPYVVRTAYRRNFEFLMAACGLASIALLAVALRRLDSSNGRSAAALAVLAITPLLLGPVMLSRFDLWPVMIAMAALVAILMELEWVGFFALGLATAVKIFPVVLLPIACVWVWKRMGRRELAACLGIFTAVLAACYLPFAIVAPHGVWHSISVQLSRPLQIESLGAASLVGLHHLFGLAESGRRRQRGDRGGSDGAPGRRAGRCLALVRQRRGQRRAAHAGERGCDRGLRGLRQGALAAVHDLARPLRAARARQARNRHIGTARRLARSHAALVSVPLLGLRDRVRRLAERLRLAARRGAGCSLCHAADRAARP
jgi:hypothetical protein